MSDDASTHKKGGYAVKKPDALRPGAPRKPRHRRRKRRGIDWAAVKRGIRWWQ